MPSEKFMRHHYGASGYSKPEDNLGATTDEVSDSLRDYVKLAFKTCNQQRVRILELEAKLAALTWRPITKQLPEKSYAHNWLVWITCDNKAGGYIDLAAYGDYYYEDEDADSSDINYVDGNDPHADEGNMRGTGWHREEESQMIDLNGKVTYWMPKPLPPIISPPADKAGA